MPRTPDPARRQLWQERFARFDPSGLTVAQFCRQEGVSPPSFYQWKKKLAASESTPNHAFIPLAFSGNDVAQAKLNLPGGATIDFDGQLDDVSLRKIIGAVITVTKHEEVS
jgi:hypothetical protein